MALRAEEDCSNSPLPGVTYFWQDADKPPSYDWEQMAQLFEVAVLAKHSISMTDYSELWTSNTPEKLH